MALLPMLAVQLIASTLWAQNQVHAEFGPEVEVPNNPYFFYAYSDSPDSRVMYIGAFVSNRYAVHLDWLDPSQPYIYRITDLSDLTTSNFKHSKADITIPNLPLKIIKTCVLKSSYSAIPFAASDAPDLNRNQTGKMYYFKISDRKFYTRTVDILDDAACTTEAGVGSDLYGCIQKDSGPGSCTQENQLDGAGNIRHLLPWLLVNDKPVGIIVSNSCSSTSVDATGNWAYKFIKLFAFRSDLLQAVPFENQ